MENLIFSTPSLSRRSVIWLLSLIIVNPLSAQVFKAGAYVSNVTPPLGKEIVGNWNSPPATHVHDELYAKCLVLDNEKTKIAIVVVDNVGIRREVFDAAKQWIVEETDLEVDHILMAATHTHSAISASGEGNARKAWQGDAPLDEYQQFVARRMADGVRIAINHLEPARIAWGGVDVPQHVFNRRWLMREPVMNPLGGMDKAKMNPGLKNPDIVKPAGPIDPEVSFIAVESAKGTPIAVLANYSLHYVGGVPRGHISADYFAIFGDRLQELMGADRQTPSFVGIMTNGTSGDVNNINFAGPGEKYLPYAKMNIVANDVAKAVYEKYQDLEFRDWVPLAAAQTEMKLKVRRASAKVLENMEAVRARPDSSDPIFSRHEKIYAERIRQLEAEWPDEIKIILQAFRIGDLGIATSPFETFAETGLEIKEKAPFKDAFTIELANGSYGYLPTPP
ncbi:MAG: hypothetical protein HKN87_13305, partial [Saprospiraceae bacterium]|nr:hypothetical protein [Saprospiraceae bacterium]